MDVLFMATEERNYKRPCAAGCRLWSLKQDENFKVYKKVSRSNISVVLADLGSYWKPTFLQPNKYDNGKSASSNSLINMVMVQSARKKY